MKKSFILLVLLCVSCAVFSQKIIDKPDYGLSNLHGKITKIELTDTETIVHFYIKYYPGQWISVPKKTHLRDVNGGDKYMIVKTEGIPFEKRYTMPESGEVSYKLFFPKLKTDVNTIDFGEGDNNPNNWSVYDIVINEQKDASSMPKVLRGNWFQADGSNQWDFGFYTNQAIFDKAVWKYKTVNQKKNNYTIVLENNGKEKTIYAKVDKKGGVKLGEDSEKLVSYSTEKNTNPNYKLVNDEAYSSNIFKTALATFSGFVKGYTPRAGRKTGTVYVNNVLTGNQDSYLVEIAENGSFSVKFPINQPQTIYVSLLGNMSVVFVEPGKETFQVLDKDLALFMGDCTTINTDLSALKDLGSYVDYQKLRETVLEMSPEAFKKVCLDIKEKQLQALNAFAQKQLVSQKALQIKKLDIEFSAYLNALSYEMYRESAERSKLLKTNPSAEIAVQKIKLDKSYYDFITPSILNNELAPLSSNYDSFINRLRFANVFSDDAISYSFHLTSETAESLQKSGVTLSVDELQMVEASKKIEKTSIRETVFYIENQNKIEKFKENHKEAYSKLQGDNPKRGVSVEALATSLKTQGVSLTNEEKELVTGSKLAQLTKEEIAIQKQFNDKYGESLKDFNEKYKEKIQQIADEKEFQKFNDRLSKVFSIKESFVYDVFTLQQKSGYLERNFTPYTSSQLKWIQDKIKHPFLSNYIIGQNDIMKAKLEANKSKRGFAVNTVKKTKGDELFDSMIAKFKGKVIYVDFWATWCGPCRSGIKEIAPLKEEMKNKDVVFLYITGETSPLKTWENSIPDIKGEHYRVSEDEWNYLKNKFNVSGIPHYVLVNKEGEVVNPKLGHHSNESLKGILEKQM
ncbi:MAG TPA: TlpA disulfide reductase family protein [Flavobacterium sp.]|nr:TlpA disulfide reductase family protein [Flavobacterium sp.]